MDTNQPDSLYIVDNRLGVTGFPPVALMFFNN